MRCKCYEMLRIVMSLLCKRYDCPLGKLNIFRGGVRLPTGSIVCEPFGRFGVIPKPTVKVRMREVCLLASDLS